MHFIKANTNSRTNEPSTVGGPGQPAQHFNRTFMGLGSEQSGFCGTCETALVDWIQLVQLGHRDAVLRVRTHDGKQGTLWCRAGNIIDAACDGLVREEAVFQALSWPGGKVSVEFGNLHRRRRIQMDTTALLLEAAVRIDARNAAAEDADAAARAGASDDITAVASEGDAERPLRRSIFDAPPVPIPIKGGGAAASSPGIPTSVGRGKQLAWGAGAAAGVALVAWISFTTWTWILDERAPPAAQAQPSRPKEAGGTRVSPAPARAAAPVSVAANEPAVDPPADLNELVIHRRSQRAHARSTKATPPPAKVASASAAGSPRVAAPAGAHPSAGVRVQIIDERRPNIQIIDERSPRVEMVE